MTWWPALESARVVAEKHAELLGAKENNPTTAAKLILSNPIRKLGR